MATAANPAARPAAAKTAAARAAPAKADAADTAEVDAAEPAPVGRKKRLLMIGAIVLAVALVAAGATTYFVMTKKRVAAQAAGLDLYGDAAAGEATQAMPTTPPTFLPLEPFVVNLADKDSDRFAQVGVTLELHDNAVAETLRSYMPAIRNGVLLVLAQKGSQELLSAEGKRTLADEIRREAMRPLAGRSFAGDNGAPVRAVHFSSFIIQ